MDDTKVLPTEIINYIIDIVASDLDVRKESLCALSRTSWNVHFHARGHLFSRIRFQFDDGSASKRDTRLLKFLTRPDNNFLLSQIRVLTIILGPSFSPHDHFTVPSTITQKIKSSWTSFSKKLDFGPDFITSAMTFLLQVPALREVALLYHGVSDNLITYVSWPAAVETYPAIYKLYDIITMPTVRRLTFKNIHFLPMEFLLGGPKAPGLHRLVVEKSFLVGFADGKYQVDLDREQSVILRKRLGSVRELAWNCPLFSSSAIWPLPERARGFGSALYPCLTKVSIGMVSEAGDPNLAFKLCLLASHTLEFIEILLLVFIPDSSQLPAVQFATDYLDNFKALRHIGYKVKSWHHISPDLDPTIPLLDIFAKLLKTCLLPMSTLSSITVETQSASYTPVILTDPFWVLFYGMDPPDEESAPGLWPNLDDAICNSNFTGLRRIRFILKFFTAPASSSQTIEAPGTSHLRSFVPNAYRHPTATVETFFKRGMGPARWFTEPGESQEFDEF